MGNSTEHNFTALYMSWKNLVARIRHERWMDRSLYGLIERYLDGWIEGWLKIWVDVFMDGWMDKSLHGC